MTTEEITAKQKALDLFHEAYATCPAYTKFVDSYKVNARSIRSIDDWEKVPIMDRYSFINKYPLEERLLGDLDLSDFYMISASSGSTGEPTFWPRDYTIDTNLEKVRGELYDQHFNISKKKTLCVIAFALGSWTGGMLETKFAWACSIKHKFTVVTPGMDKTNVLAFISKLHKFYDQTILLAYPPFLTDFIDYAKERHFDLKKVNLKATCTGERFSQKWRRFIAKNINRKPNLYDIIDLYACSDTGVIGWETKETIDILDHAYVHPSFSQEIFGSYDTPTLVTYNPIAKYLEAKDGEILITARQPMPLVRYNIHDRGGLFTRNELIRATKKAGMKKPKLEKKNDAHFVFVLGRSDAMLLAANIYIEDIKYCLEHSTLKYKITGNFKYGREEGEDLRYRMRIIIYLKKGKIFSAKEKKRFKEEFYADLMKVNNDFKLIRETTKMKKIRFEFKIDNPDKFRTTKLKYFL